MSEFSPASWLVDRVLHAARQQMKCTFVVGSGLTCPVEKQRGVPGVEEMTRLSCKPFPDDDVSAILQLMPRMPGLAYQQAIHHLNGRRGPDEVARIVRDAVLSARKDPDPLAGVVERLKSLSKPSEWGHLCESLVIDTANWVLRPGIESLGAIVAEFPSIFGEQLITTNFDPLLDVAIVRGGGAVAPFVAPKDASPGPPPRSATQTIYLHGSWYGMTLHTSDALAATRPFLNGFLSQLLRDKLVIVIGYGGWNDAFTKALIDANSQYANVLWAFREDQESEIEQRYSRLLGTLGGGLNRVVYYKGVDADSLLPDLLANLRSRVAEQISLPNSPDSDRCKPQTPVFAASPIDDPTADLRQTPPSGDAIEYDPAALEELRRRCGEFSNAGFRVVDDQSYREQTNLLEPNFVLFKRAGSVLLAVAPNQRPETPGASPAQMRIATRRLQKTTEPEVESVLLTPEGCKLLGFHPGRVHPLFSNTPAIVDRIFVDGDLLAQAIWFPSSLVAIPLYQRDGSIRRILAPLHAFLEFLQGWFGRQAVLFANIVERRPRQWRQQNPILRRLIDSRSARVRFAPTPSNRLHLGSARTALVNYLLSLKSTDKLRFFLRFDDTDTARSKEELVPAIKDELRWLGIKWDDHLDCFHQASQPQSRRYNQLISILSWALLTRKEKDGSVYLAPLAPDDYYNIWFDWRRGPIVEHRPPLKWERDAKGTPAKPKSIQILRGRRGNPLYRYAGLVDDVRAVGDGDRLTWVVRDFRQAGLTEVQAHIRRALESARQRLSNDDAAHDIGSILESAGLSPQSSIPLPIYFHIQVMTDDPKPTKSPVSTTMPQTSPSKIGQRGRKRPRRAPRRHRLGTVKRSILSKSEEQPLYTLHSLRHKERMLPESIVAYLVSTVVGSKNSSWKVVLRRNARILAQAGIDSGLGLLAQELDPDSIVRSMKHIPCKLERIRIAERLVINSLPTWTIRMRLRDAGIVIDDRMLDRVVSIRHHFASWRQVLTVVQRPAAGAPISESTAALLRPLRTEPDANLMAVVIAEIQRRRERLRDARNSNVGWQRATKELAEFLGDIRVALTGAADSIPIERLFQILGDTESAERLRGVMRGRS